MNKAEVLEEIISGLTADLNDDVISNYVKSNREARVPDEMTVAILRASFERCIKGIKDA